MRSAFLLKVSSRKTCGFHDAFSDPNVIKKNLSLAWTDRGMEMIKAKDYLKSHYNITIYHTKTGLRKSNPAENLIKQIEFRLFRELDAKDSSQWLQPLIEITNRYNNSPQASLANQSPLQVLKDKKAFDKVKVLNAKKLIKFYQKNDKKPLLKKMTKLEYY